MLPRFIKNYIKKFFLQSPKPLNIKKKVTIKSLNIYPCINSFGKLNDVHSYTNCFGNLNKDKIFYLIKRSPGTGLFSNVAFVLNHLIIAKKFDFIPIVDMKNYITIYNEEKPIKNTSNAWR